METVNVSKKQQPDQRAENRSKPLVVPQHSGSIPHQVAGLSWSLVKNVY